MRALPVAGVGLYFVTCVDVPYPGRWAGVKPARFHPAALVSRVREEGGKDTRSRTGARDETTAGDAVMKKGTVVARNAAELADALGLDRAEGIEIAVRSALNTKIIAVIGKRRLTHAQVASLAGTSRTRVTAIMNRNTKDISTDLMLRVLGALGVFAKITFGRAA
jgi:predicted XRE-type DNA-binding protein